METPMTKTYSQIVKQIAALQAEADRARKKEAGDVIAKIRSAIHAYGLTAADLGLGAARPAGAGPKPAASAAAGAAAKPIKRRRRRGAAKAAAAPKVVKFRNDSGGTWGGRGKRPQWLRDALAGGKQLSDFLVK
jgi:DNA-binding protein H-NS